MVGVGRSSAWNLRLPTKLGSGSSLLGQEAIGQNALRFLANAAEGGAGKYILREHYGSQHGALHHPAYLPVLYNQGLFGFAERLQQALVTEELVPPLALQEPACEMQIGWHLG